MKLSPADIQGYCEKLGVEAVPIDESRGGFNYTLPEILEKVRGKNTGGSHTDGVVVRTQDFEHNHDL